MHLLGHWSCLARHHETVVMLGQLTRFRREGFPDTRLSAEQHDEAETCAYGY